MPAPMTAPPLLIHVKRRYFDEFAAGAKTIEYRRHRGRFTARNFWPGRRVIIASGRANLAAIVERFAIELADARTREFRTFWPDITADDEIAAIELRVIGRHIPSNC
jgi:hypothetical protein